MSEKIAKTICRYGQANGHSHLRLENKEGKLLCFYGPETGAEYLRLDCNEAASIAETFRYLVGAVDNELFVDKRFKIADKDGVISGRATLLPASNGEKLLITLRNSKPQARRWGALGLNRDQQKILKSALAKKSGVIIIASAAENGSSSTYYSLLQAANNNKSTYSLEAYPGNSLNNTNIINPKKYGGIAASLDKLISLDSELIGVDADLNQNDIKAIWRVAYSGRLIIAVLPALNAAQALKTIKQSGLSTAAIASQLSLILAQKLFPRPCSKCLRVFDPGINIKKTIIQRWPVAATAWPKKLYRNHGCLACRPQANATAVFEIMRFLPDGRLAAGYQPLIIDALTKAGLGLINIEDIAAWADTNKKL